MLTDWNQTLSSFRRLKLLSHDSIKTLINSIFQRRHLRIYTNLFFSYCSKWPDYKCAVKENPHSSCFSQLGELWDWWLILSSTHSWLFFSPSPPLIELIIHCSHLYTASRLLHVAQFSYFSRVNVSANAGKISFQAFSFFFFFPPDVTLHQQLPVVSWHN